MHAKERNKMISTYLTTIIERGSDLSYLVSKKKNSEKMIMYTGAGNKVTFDVPYKTMRRDEKERFMQKFGGEFRKATYAFTKEVSVSEATELTDRVFCDVFGAKDNYSLEIEFELD